MGRGVFIGVLLFGSGLPAALAGTASAQEFNHVITVYATVAEQRAVYIDSHGDIYKVAGNTTHNITPRVYTADNKLTGMTDKIMGQYQAFLSQYHGQLAAGKVYDVNPLVVQVSLDDRTIQLDTSGLTLGSAQNG